jgi:hypothetical protein
MANKKQAEQAAEKLAEICENPTIDLSPVRKEAKTVSNTLRFPFHRR